MESYPAPPIYEPDAQSPSDVRAVAAEMEARLKVARSLPANCYLGQRPDLHAHPLGRYLILAFPVLAVAAMITLLFTVGPVLWGVSAAAVLSLVVGVLLGLPENRRYDRLRKHGVWAPAVWIAVEADAFDPDWEDLPKGHLIDTLDPDLAADLPRLVDIGQKIRLGTTEVGQSVMQEVQNRLQSNDLQAPPLLLPPALTGNSQSWYASLEFAPVFLPDQTPSQALCFVLTLPEPTAAWHLALLQSICLWGDAGEALTRAFPLTKLEVVR